MAHTKLVVEVFPTYSWRCVGNLLAQDRSSQGGRTSDRPGKDWEKGGDFSLSNDCKELRNTASSPGGPVRLRRGDACVGAEGPLLRVGNACVAPVGSAAGIHRCRRSSAIHPWGVEDLGRQEPTGRSFVALRGKNRVVDVAFARQVVESHQPRKRRRSASSSSGKSVNSLSPRISRLFEREHPLSNW